MKPAYTKMPAPPEWLSDSSTLLSVRKSDAILSSIDGLVMALEQAAASVRPVILVDLFWSLDYWLKIFKSNATMDPKRELAIHRLYVYTAVQLCQVFGCPVNALVNKLEQAFGRTVGEHGIAVDIEEGWVRYMSQAERKLYRLRFRGGLAYQFQWWNQPVNLNRLVLTESKQACDMKAFFQTGADKTDFGGFVMTMGRDFYMARHGGRNQANARVFHSSYFGNDAVCCAGTMLIRAGQILKICPDSGHFQPGDVNVMALLQALRMLQLDLKKVVVQDYKGRDLMTAAEVLGKGDWSAVLRHMADNAITLKSNQVGLKAALEVQSARLHPQPAYYGQTPTGVGGEQVADKN